MADVTTKEPDDFVIATGNHFSVRDFVVILGKIKP